MSKKNKPYRIILIIAAAVVLLVAGIFYYIRNIQQSLWNQAVSEILEVTSQGSHAFEVYVEKDIQILKRIVKHLSQTDGSEQIGNVIDLFGDSEVSFTVVDLDRGIVYGSQEEGRRQLGAEERAVYDGFADQGLREPFEDEFSGQQVIGGYQRFTFADGAPGLVQVRRPMSNVAAEFMLSFYDDTGFSYVVNREGEILIRVSHQNDGSFTNILTEVSTSDNLPGVVETFRSSMEQGMEGALRFTFNGEPYVFAFTPIAGTDGWYLVAVVPDGVILRHADEILNSSQTFMLLVGGVLLFAVLFLYMERRSMRRLMEKEDDLQYREQLFSILANNTNDVFLMFSTGDYSVEYVSPNVERVLGIPPEAVKKDIRVLEQPCRSKAYLSLPEIQESGNTVYEGERIHQTDGSRRWFLDTVYKTWVSGSERLVAVLSDRTHEQQSEQALRDALEIAKNANDSKSTFLSNMSHDIRTPMNAIIGFSTLLQRDANNPDKVQEYTRKITSSSQHLLGLINDVLDMSKIESGKTTLNIGEISLAELIDELDSMLQPQARAKQQEFRISVYDICNEEVLGDRLRINQILINILSNAVKYTPEGGKIEMTVRQLPQFTKHYARFRFVIADNGIGMTREYLETIFQPFSRESNSKTFGIQGTGLGMAITKNLVDLMGGTLAVESELDHGSTFTLDLELRIKEQDVDPDFWKKHGVTNLLVVDDEEEVCLGIQNAMSSTGIRLRYALGGQSAVRMAEEAEEQGAGYDLVLIDWQMPDISGIETARRIRQIVPAHVPIMILTAYDIDHLEEEGAAAGIDAYMQKPFFLSNLKMIVGSLKSDGGTTSAQAADDDQSDLLAGRHLLAAEDNELNSEILLELLEMAGATCDLPHNGQEAVERFEQSAPGQYDVILMDVQMPVMNGYEATRAIRRCSHPEAQTIPIIAMTANAFSEDVKEALDAGMNKHVAKPIDMEHLNQVIRELIGDR